jgi:hypothetical protein
MCRRVMAAVGGSRRTTQTSTSGIIILGPEGESSEAIHELRGNTSARSITSHRSISTLGHFENTIDNFEILFLNFINCVRSLTTTAIKSRLAPSDLVRISSDGHR